MMILSKDLKIYRQMKMNRKRKREVSFRKSQVLSSKSQEQRYEKERERVKIYMLPLHNELLVNVFLLIR